MMRTAIHRPWRTLVVILVVIVAVFALLAATASALGSGSAGAAPAATTLTYGKPTTITGIGSTFSTISCVSATFCMGGDENGRLLRYDGSSWTVSKHFAASEGFIDSITCVSTHFCMAAYEPDIGTGFRLLTFNGHSWKASSAFAGNYYGQSDCPSAKLCFVFDDQGYIHGWNGSRWVVLKTRFDNGVEALSCASVRLCFAIGNNGGLFRYDGHAWTRYDHKLSQDFWISLSCPTATFCMAFATWGKVATYRNGVWARPTMIANPDDFQGMDGTCASPDFCVVADFSGHTETYTNGKWTEDATLLQVPRSVREDTEGRDVSCDAVNSCVATGPDGSYWVRTASGWGSRRTDPRTADPVAALDCTSTASCVAWDQRLSYGTYNGDTWTAFADRSVIPDREPTSVSCPSEPYCMVVTNTGAFAERLNGTWERPFRDINTTAAPGRAIHTIAVSCSASTLCLAALGSGSAPATGSVTVYNGKRWSGAERPDGKRVLSVSCVSGVRFCAAGTSTGSVITYSGRSWSSAKSLPGAGAISSVSCSSAKSCMAVSGSRTYAYDGTTWTAFTVPGQPTLLHVSCASSTACGAVGFHTAAYFDGRSWSVPERIDGTGDDNVAIACPAAESCVVATSGGEAIVGS